MKIGFTGARNGITPIQQRIGMKILNDIWNKETIDEAHHGDCLGADAWFHSIISVFFEQTKVVIHPPDRKKHRAFCKGGSREPKPYLTRNHDIVDETDTLLAMSGTDDEIMRSGTWATIRYARKVGKSIVIVFPDGSVKNESN